MDLFEFILIITSVVYALAIAQILAGIGRLAQTDATIRWYLPHMLWTVILFTSILITWWAGWEFRDVDWTFPKFVFLFVSPVMILFATSLLIPQQIGDKELDLERHFNKIRKPILLAFLCALFVQFIDGSLLVNQPWWFPGRLPQIAALGAVVVGASTENRKLHTISSAGVILFFANIIYTRFWFPE